MDTAPLVTIDSVGGVDEFAKVWTRVKTLVQPISEAVSKSWVVRLEGSGLSKLPR